MDCCWWLRQLLLALLMTALLPSTLGGTGDGGNVWAAVNLSECNSTCVAEDSVHLAPGALGGVQQVNFACYAATSASVRRLPGTKFFLATSASGQLPTSSCAGIQQPAQAFVPCRRQPRSGNSCLRPSYSWQLNAAASAAASLTCQTATPAATEVSATECGRRGQVKLSLVCRRRQTTAASFDAVDEYFCLADGLPRPEPVSVPCRQTAGCRAVWKAGEWSVCSRECGLGEMARSVECSQLTDSPDGPVYAPAPGRCSDTEARPHAREFCVLRPECPPFYRLRPGKCLPAFSTSGDGGASTLRRWCNETGLHPTHAECAQLVGDLSAALNQTLRRPVSACRSLKRPPVFQRCRVDAETLRLRGISCTEPVDAELQAPPQLIAEPAGSLLVQMERLPAMDARCGQEVTMIPGTRLRLHCDVKNFKAVELRWRKLGRPTDFHSEAERRTKGKKCGRVCVSNGDLLFARFKPRDSGTYEVTAGKAKARVQLRWHTAYDAYLRAYLPRAHLLRRGGAGFGSSQGGGVGGSVASASAAGTDLFRDAPTRGAADTLSWMAGPWSDCPCGAAVGQATPPRHRRAIRCERLRAGVYAVVEPALCQRLLGPSPATEADCGTGVGSGSGGRACPIWRVGNWDDLCPDDRCYTRDTSLTLRSVVCHDPGRNVTLPDSECHATRVLKPETARQCRNPACVPEWLASPWSACSASCGAFGLRSRRIQCLWRGTGLPAGLACEKQPLPRGYKSCYEGPCHQLGCVDLLPACKIYQASALCAHPSLRKSCCQTCNAYELQVYQRLRSKRV